MLKRTEESSRPWEEWTKGQRMTTNIGADQETDRSCPVEDTQDDSVKIDR